jgi:hypothetical protein
MLPLKMKRWFGSFGGSAGRDGATQLIRLGMFGLGCTQAAGVDAALNGFKNGCFRGAV